MSKAAVILSGCGHADGAEIRESVLALLALDQRGVKAEIFAPDKTQAVVKNFITGKPVEESRNVMVEAARIARGAIKPLNTCQAKDFDMLVLPGGFGVALNLSNFAEKGAEATVEPEFARVIQEFYAQKKPIGAICIAPAVLAVALKGEGLTLTIGDDAGTAAAIVACGHTHEDCATESAVIDKTHRVASCSAYMRNDALSKIAEGIDACVGAVVEMAQLANKQAA